MSILIGKKTSNAGRPTSNIQIVGRLTRSLPLTRSTDLPVDVAPVPSTAFCETPGRLTQTPLYHSTISSTARWP